MVVKIIAMPSAMLRYMILEYARFKFLDVGSCANGPAPAPADTWYLVLILLLLLSAGHDASC